MTKLAPSTLFDDTIRDIKSEIRHLQKGLRALEGVKTTMNKTRRKRSRRAAHAARAAERNEQRGYTSSDLARMHTDKETTNEKQITTAMLRSKVGKAQPSYHKPKALKKSPADADTKASGGYLINNPSEIDWEKLVDKAKRQKRSIKALAEKAGWKKIGNDPKDRTNWEA